jgi:tetratricopeptide (TPR) repeat protein
MSRAWLVWCLAELGDFEAASACADHGIRTAEEFDDPWSLGHVLFASGYALTLRGHFDQAVSVLERGLTLSRSRDFPLLITIIQGTLGYAHVLSGHVREGLTLMEPAAQALLKVSATAATRAAAWLGEAYLAAGRMDDAAAAAAKARDLAVKRCEPGNQAWSLRLLGELELRAEDLETARDHYEQGLRLAAELGMRPLEALCRLGIGMADRRAARVAAAQDNLATAVLTFSALGMPRWLGEAEAELRRDPIQY